MACCQRVDGQHDSDEVDALSDRELPNYPELPNRWQAISPEQIYCSDEGRLVSFSQSQIGLGILYDALGKHLRAINKGIVSPKGNMCSARLPPMRAETSFDVGSLRIIWLWSATWSE